MFCNLSLREITASGPTPAAQARVRFINCGDDATSLQTISAGQSSQTSSDHDDPRAGCDLCCTEQRCRQGQSGGRRRNRANKLTTRHGGIICGRVAPVGLGCCRRGVAKEFSKRCVRHNEIGVLRRDCIVLREGLQCRVSHTRLYFAICQSGAGFGNMCCSTEIAELAETDAANFAGASPPL